MPSFKDEHILVIAPGSQTTLAQLGLPESFTPASTKIRTRMFQAGDGKWEPYKIREVKKATATAQVTNGADVEMSEAVSEDKMAEEELEFEEDLDSDEGAVYPLTEGRITNMAAFLALMNHIHSILSPTLHTPILLIAQPAWTAQDIEALTQFFFEKFKTPAFCIMDSALAISYAYGVEHATVVDIGFQKADITAIHDYSVQHVGRTISLKNSGGDAMTNRLLELLQPKGWTRDMCEQLKKSSFCEILPAGVPLPKGEDAKDNGNVNLTTAATAGAGSSGPVAKITDAPRIVEMDGEDDTDGDKVIDDDGVLDVASIVASGKTQEFLAQQERKKQMAAARKAAKDAREAADAAAAKPVRLPNSKREKVLFHYQERKAPDDIAEVPENGKAVTTEIAKEKTPEAAAPTNGDAPTVTTVLAANVETKPVEDAQVVPDASVSVEDASAKREHARAAKREEKRKAREGAGDPMLLHREIEVGTERFQAASNGLLERIADAVHRTVLAGTEPAKRSDLWDSLIVVGNGSRVRGFRDALLAMLTNKYLISPSSATIFSSELPSNLSTPMGTGSQTPQRDFPPGQHALPTGSGVNPLLLAATTASNPALNPNLSLASAFGNGGGGGHSSHSQTPTSIKIAKVPEYFPQFKNEGFEECVFLGAQIAAKVIFVHDQGVSSGFMSRVQYNESGPSGIHEVGLTF